MTVTELWERFLAACGGIVIIGGAIAMVRRWLNPAVSLREEVTSLTKCNEETAKTLRDISETNKLLIKSMVELLDYSITGTGIEKVETVKSELLTYLAGK